MVSHGDYDLSVGARRSKHHTAPHSLHDIVVVVQGERVACPERNVPGLGRLGVLHAQC